MIEIVSGIVTAVVIIVISLVLSKFFTMKLIAATCLVAIAFIYTGFALKENPAGLIILEVGATLLFYFFAIIGYTRNNLLIAYGIILHGVWDIFHHQGSLVKTNIPSYWPSFCFIIDIIDGLFFLVVFKKAKDTSPARRAAF